MVRKTIVNDENNDNNRVETEMETEEQLAERLFSERNDPGAWEQKASDVKVRQPVSEVLSVRVPSDVLDSVEEAARVLGESISEFVRGAILLKLNGPVPLMPSLDRIWSGADQLIVWQQYSGSRTEIFPSSTTTVPDMPPLTVQGPIRRQS